MRNKNKILFYYPQHFNRTAHGTNPFYDELLAVCDKNGISYDLYEEPDAGTDKPHNKKAKSAKCFWYAVTIIRKIVSIIFRHKDFYEREKIVAKSLNCVTLNRYKYGKYITISGSMFHLFSHLNENAEVYDVQHGVLGKHHQTFFDQKTFKLRPQFYDSNLHFTFWGEGYLSCFAEGEEDVLNGRIHVLGYPNSSKPDIDSKRNNAEKVVVVSLQFTHSVDNAELNSMKKSLVNFLEQIEKQNVKVLLKQHPRFNNCINIDDIFKRFKNISLTTEPLAVLAQKAFLHITYYSTTAFEFAEYGVPTFFLNYEGESLKDNMFYAEYKYPLYLENTPAEVIEHLSDEANYLQDATTVKQWFHKFYTPFKESYLLEILK